MHECETGILTAGSIKIGAHAAEIRPFEPAGIDWTIVNAKRRSDPTYGQNVIPDAVVGSCSQCCMAEINGKPNLLGRLHRKKIKSCSQCPVGHAASLIQARDADGRLLYARNPDGTRRPLTQHELVIMEMDGSE